MAADRLVRIPRLTWIRLTGELRGRGRGRRESGAFLLGTAGSGNGRVEAFVCYDDLDPDALKSGIVTLHGPGLSALWKLCSDKGFEVLADVHTHPTIDVRQSSVDQQHPMLPVVGHIAMILPNFGRTSKWSLAGVGVYVYAGAYRWSSTRGDSTKSPVQLCVW